jgi:endogenous inhibitor of DNA gyrase (YacG/DUF329 family)
MCGEGSQPPGRCPICGRPRVHRFRPFCSAACRDRDLLAWIEERYRLPAVEAEADEDQAGDDVSWPAEDDRQP